MDNNMGSSLLGLALAKEMVYPIEQAQRPAKMSVLAMLWNALTR
ncbi:hypothetical protein [Vibrio tritonius]|nr:hypothetical protein [Vibrio tritonius]